MPRVFSVVLACLMVVACGTPLKARAPIDSAVSGYTLEGRFSLREADRSYSGRVRWAHGALGNLVLVQDPLGAGVAELTERPQGASMKMRNGDIVEAASAQILMKELTGIAVPVADIARWMTGRDVDGATLQRDAFGRVAVFHGEMWRFDYSYDIDDRDALPATIVVVDRNGLELKLRVESWEIPGAR